MNMPYDDTYTGNLAWHNSTDFGGPIGAAKHYLYNPVAAGVSALGGFAGNVGHAMMSKDDRTPDQKYSDTVGAVGNRLQGVGSSKNATRLGVPTPAGVAPMWSFKGGQPDIQAPKPVRSSPDARAFAEPPQHQTPLPEINSVEPPKTSQPPERIPSYRVEGINASYDPRAELSVQGLLGKADGHLANQQNLQQDWLNANANNIGHSPLAKLASYGAVSSAVSNLGTTMASRGKAALDTMNPINTAIKEGNTNPQADVVGKIKDRSALSELKNKNMFPSDLEKAHTNLYNKQADATLNKTETLKHQQDLRLDAQKERLNQHFVDAATKLAGGDPEKYPAALSSVMESYQNQQAGMKYRPGQEAIPGSFPYGVLGMGKGASPEVKGSWSGTQNNPDQLAAQHYSQEEIAAYKKAKGIR